MAQKFKNIWGSQGMNTDPQRSDLFYVKLAIPSFLTNAGSWDDDIGFAVEKFPFPERTRETIPIKFLQQTNHILGADTATAPISITVRHAFNRRTAEILERWHWLISNPKTGGVALTSDVKTNGIFQWQVPNVAYRDVDNAVEANAMSVGAQYTLEGCFPTGLKPSDADMATGGLVTLSFNLSVDRYYPDSPDKLTSGIKDISQAPIQSLIPTIPSL